MPMRTWKLSNSSNNVKLHFFLLLGYQMWLCVCVVHMYGRIWPFYGCIMSEQLNSNEIVWYTLWRGKYWFAYSKTIHSHSFGCNSFVRFAMLMMKKGQVTQSLPMWIEKWHEHCVLIHTFAEKKFVCSIEKWKIVRSLIRLFVMSPLL